MEIEKLINLCTAKGIRRVKHGDFEAEFFEPKAPVMDLDPKNLAKVLADSMPPDSAMLFASTEGVIDSENPTPQQREQINMP